MAGEEGCGEITRLPEGFISHAISLTSPIDSCRSALVSTTFRLAADSDTVWERFLPSDYKEILLRAVDPVDFSSKKELYFRLSGSILINGGRIIFRLERSTGRKCYTLSARELHIVWGDTPEYWTWKHLADSRFPEVAEILKVRSLDIKGRMDCKLLSRQTNYAAYLIFKLPRKSFGFWVLLSASVLVGSHSSTSVVSLKRETPNTPKMLRYTTKGFRKTPEGIWVWHDGDDGVLREPHARHDGWMELELGEFFSGDGDEGNVEISLFERGAWKKGLIIEGIEVRPK